MTSSTVVDATGHALDAGSARRIVSLVPSITETVAALAGGPGPLVGVTPYCVEPDEARRAASVVGGPVGVDVDLVRSLSPDLVLAAREENDRGEVLGLRDAGLRVYVAAPRSAEDVERLLGDLGRLVGAEGRASREVARLRATRLEAERRGADRAPRRVACPVWLDPPQAVGTGTYAADLIRLAGGRVEPGRAGYPPLLAREVDPEVLLLPDEPYRFGREDLPRLGLERSAAARAGRVHSVDGKLLFWYGVRTARAIEELEAVLGR